MKSIERDVTRVVQGDVGCDIEVRRVGGDVTIRPLRGPSFEASSIATVLRLQAALAAVSEELLELGKMIPEHPALAPCEGCGRLVFVNEFHPATRYYCANTKKEICFEASTAAADLDRLPPKCHRAGCEHRVMPLARDPFCCVRCRRGETITAHGVKRIDHTQACDKKQTMIRDEYGVSR